MAKKKNNNPVIVFLLIMLITSMLVGYHLNTNTKNESKTQVAEIQRKADSSIKLMSDSLKFTISRYLQLQDLNKKVVKDTLRLYYENKHLNRTVTKYVKINNDAQFGAMHELSGDVTILENMQRERESGQR